MEGRREGDGKNIQTQQIISITLSLAWTHWKSHDSGSGENALMIYYGLAEIFAKHLSISWIFEKQDFIYFILTTKSRQKRGN